MSRDLGVMRDPARMKSAITELESLASPGTEPLSRQTIEAANLLTIATAVSKAAMERTESRGCHRRTDYAGPIAAWERHINVRLHDGAIRIDDHA
jgi:aspartate oxidase